MDLAAKAETSQEHRSHWAGFAVVNGIQTNQQATSQDTDSGEQSVWQKRYGERHSWKRVDEFPEGITQPKKVRLYQRADHFLLNWWDPEQKKNLSERIDGDLLAALFRAREIDDRITSFRRSGVGCRKLDHQTLVASFLKHTNTRAEAGEIDPATVSRYRSALEHYSHFAEIPDTRRRCPTVNRINKEFALNFGIYLKQIRVSPNGHPNTEKKPLRSTRFIESVVRSMLRWASDPHGGALLGDGFSNPFACLGRKTDTVHDDLFGEPDITREMAAEFLNVCDEYQLPIFAVLVFYGLRPSELCFAFREDLNNDWLRIACRPEIGYHTKGRRDKRLPLTGPIRTLLSCESNHGLLFVRRTVADGRVVPSLKNASEATLNREFASRCEKEKSRDASRRHAIRDRLVAEAGGINYDRIQNEYQNIAASLNWQPAATLKDFRHLFNTSMQNAGMPEFYRRYLLGQSPGRSALVNYTHLNQLRKQYERAVQSEFERLIEVLNNRLREFETNARMCEFSTARASDAA